MQFAGSNLRTFVAKALVLASLAFFTLNLNTLGIKSQSLSYSQDIANLWLGERSWYYPDTSLASGPAARVVVVLADEDSLRLRGQEWPPGPAFHAAVLHELAALNPKAIFVDFLMLDDRGEAQRRSFADAVSALPESVKVYVPRMSRLKQGTGEVARVIPVDAGKLFSGGDFINRRYPLFSDDSVGKLKSAATQIYCDQAPEAGLCSSIDQGHDFAAGIPPAMEVIWSPRAHAFNTSWSSQDCQMLLSRIKRDVLAGRTEIAPTCPSVPTVFLSDLLSGGSAAAFGTFNERLFELFQDAIVMYGGNFLASTDVVHTTTRSVLPGVFYHAAAYDNLVAFNGKPKIAREYRAHRMGIYLLEFAVLSLLASGFLLRQKWLQSVSPSDEPTRAPTLATRLSALGSRLPLLLAVAIVCVAALFAAMAPTLQKLLAWCGALAVVLYEILHGANGRGVIVAKRTAIFLTAMLVSSLIVVCYVWTAYRWLGLPPVDWLGLLVFTSLGWFLARKPVSRFVESVGKRSSRLATGAADTSVRSAA